MSDYSTAFTTNGQTSYEGQKNARALERANGWTPNRRGGPTLKAGSPINYTRDPGRSGSLDGASSQAVDRQHQSCRQSASVARSRFAPVPGGAARRRAVLGWAAAACDGTHPPNAGWQRRRRAIDGADPGHSAERRLGGIEAACTAVRRDCHSTPRNNVCFL